MGNKKLQSLFREWLSVENMKNNMSKILGLVADNPRLELTGWRIVNNRIAPDQLRSPGNDKASIEVEFFDKDTQSAKIVTFESFKKLDNLLVKRLNELNQFYPDLHPKQLVHSQEVHIKQTPHNRHFNHVPIIDIDENDIPY